MSSSFRRDIVIATGNPHKVEEIASIFAHLGVGLRLLSLKDVGREIPEPAETGDTFEANATIKALAYARAVQGVVLADDSGLEIDALGGRPGVTSSHYATDGRETGASRAERDAANNARVLRELDGVPAERRTARFVCVMVLADGTSGAPAVLTRARGEFAGRIGLPPGVPRGDHGFGYDPLFLAGPECERTGAELSSTEKNARSHRGAAARLIAAWLLGPTR